MATKSDIWDLHSMIQYLLGRLKREKKPPGYGMNRLYKFFSTLFPLTLLFVLIFTLFLGFLYIIGGTPWWYPRNSDVEKYLPDL
jgi:hypothetical protein